MVDIKAFQFLESLSSLQIIPAGCFGGINDKRKGSGNVCFGMIGCRRAMFESSKSYEHVDVLAATSQLSFSFCFSRVGRWDTVPYSTLRHHEEEQSNQTGEIIFRNVSGINDCIKCIQYFLAFGRRVLVQSNLQKRM